jgi:NADPH:quinone reductase-like Zn-dependent oxidoreductase
VRAYLIEGPGRASLADVAVPEPGPRDVLLRMRLASLNHLDVFARSGLSGAGIRPHAYPLVTGCDAIGTVAATGSEVEGWREGDLALVYPSLACGDCPACYAGEHSMCRAYGGWGEQTWGALSEYAVAPAANLVRLDEADPLHELVTVPVAYTTAWRALMTAGGLRAGETVLIVGVGGGVATAALTIALLAGATVLVASGHDWKLERAVALGAADGVNGRREDVAAWVRDRTGGHGADLVFDSVGTPTWRSSIASLAMGGRLTICGATGGDRPDFSIRELYQSHRRIVGAPMGGRPDFDAVLGLVRRGALRPVLDSVRPLAEVGDALDRLERGEQFGKIVVEL